MRRGFACVLVASVVLLPACTDNDPPTPPATSTVNSSTSPPTPTVVPPTRPASKPTPASAEAFVRFFWATFNYANKELDPSALEAISGTDCLFCKSAVQVIEGLEDRQAHVTGSEVSVESVVVPPVDLEKGAVITAVISQSPGQTQSSSGTTDSPGTRNVKSLISLDWSGHEWRVRDVTNDKTTGTPW